MRNALSQSLKSCRLFQEIPETILQGYFENGQYCTVEFSKGAMIYFRGEFCKSVDVILKGNLSAQKIDDEGNVLIVNKFSEGDTIGENLLFSQNGQYPMTVVADTEVNILKLQKELVLSIGQRDRRFLSRLLTSISDKTLVLAGKINLLSYKSLRQKIIGYLIHEYHIQNSNEIRLRFSKKELAERMGVRRTSLSRELCKMKKDGLISYDARKIYLCNLSELLEIHERS
jgi:CRP-like cAMP-binding protein